jgi:uncharacterized OB-fold protein
MESRKPALYTAPLESGSSVPQLKGGRCACGYVFFPMQTFGCERCGATGSSLQAQLLEGRGRLVSSARVLMHAADNRKPPFAVATVKLDSGPVLRTLFADHTEESLPVGTRVQACLVEVARSDSGDPIGELRFSSSPEDSDKA